MAEILAGLDAALAAEGLARLGAFHPERSDVVPEAAVAGNRPATLVLVGNAGPAMWRRFSRSPEFAAPADPLDCWSRRVLTAVAARLGAGVVFPFEGPPYWPFQQWALRAGGVSPSPLGILVHDVYGPWFAYRGALLFADRLPLPEPASEGPCPGCAEKPCLEACPAGALTRETAYDARCCREFVRLDPAPDCSERGCLVRHACPYGRAHAYDPAQASFHMAAFAGG